jgi:hypothetical protein
MPPGRRLWSLRSRTLAGRLERGESRRNPPPRVLLACTASAWLICGFSQAQSPPSAIITFDHDGQSVVGFAVYATRREDGAKRRLDLGHLNTVNGRYRVTLPPLEDGTWRLEVAAYNDAGESPRIPADPGELRVGDPGKVRVAAPNPPKPGGGTTPAKPPPQAAPGEPQKGGGLKKLWRIIVGDDRHDPPQRPPNP